MRGDDLSANQNRLVDMMPKIGDSSRMAPIFVSIGKKPEEIARRVQSVFAEDFGARGTDAFEELDRSVGSDH